MNNQFKQKIFGFAHDVVLHPFFVATMVPLAAFQQTAHSVLWEETVSIFVLSEIVALVIFVACSLWLKSTKLGGLATTVIMLQLMNFKVAELLLKALWAGCFNTVMPDFVSLAVTSVVLVCSLWFIVAGKHKPSAAPIVRKKINELNVALNIVFAAMVVMSVVPIVTYIKETEEIHKTYIARMRAAVGDKKLTPTASAPDIYYIILDAAANTHTLKEIFNYDDSEFRDFLTSTGFYVVPEAASNYDRTLYSVSSSLNMSYVNMIPDELGKGFADETIFWRLIEHSNVIHMLKSAGYKFVNISSGTSITDVMPNADFNLRTSYFNEFAISVLRLTPLSAMETYVPVLRSIWAQVVLGPTVLINQASQLPSPKFVLIHASITHGPYIFFKDGKPRPLAHDFTLEKGDPDKYVQNLEFGEQQAKEWITTILKNSVKPPVIILQSDHGPHVTLFKPTYLNERMRILNAYLLPGMHNKGLYKSITPVNSFRVVFNDYFNAGLPMLPDKSWWARNWMPGFEWEEVHSQLHF